MAQHVKHKLHISHFDVRGPAHRKHSEFSFRRAFAQCWLGKYRGADKSLARPTSQCNLFDGENISFDASLVIQIANSTNIPPIMITNRIYENQNLLSL